MRPNNDIRYVGALQDFGEPFVVLYVDVSNRRLYLMVRVNPESEEMVYAVAEVHPGEVEAYMHEDASLSKILNGKKFWLAVFINGYLSIKDADIPDVQKSINNMDEFNPEDCDDDYWIQTFLKRVKNNKPLELTPCL